MQNNQTVVKEKMNQRYLQAAVVATAFALPALSHAEGEITPAQITGAVTDIGMPALIGAAVAVMLGIAALIWGGKKIIGFFSK